MCIRDRPVGAMLASILFGFASALGNKMEGLPGFSSYLVSAIPYIVTIIGLAIYAVTQLKKSRKKS